MTCPRVKTADGFSPALPGSGFRRAGKYAHLRHPIRLTGLLLLSLSFCPGPGAAETGSTAVNQVGYRPAGRKFAFFSHPVDSFWVQVAASGTTVLGGRASLWKSFDAATGQAVYRADFSQVRSAGEFRVVSSAGDTSGVFSISDTVYNEVYRKALKGFYYQRCGSQLGASYAGPYQHPACHLLDGVFHPSSDTSGFHASTGGWHDAGDYGKYVVNAGITVGTLLLAYEMLPSRFGGDDLGIPESGNGVPDILDEARYELEWFLTMQRDDGGFWFKETREQFEAFVMPQGDSSPRYLYTVSSAATGDASATLARAARCFSSYDPDFSRVCLEAARQGWMYLSDHRTIVPAGGFTNPSGTNTGEYGDTDDSDERLWAAAELFETTGEDQYHTYFQSAYVFGTIFGGAMWWGDVRPLGLLTYLNSRQPAALASVKAELHEGLHTFCAGQVSKGNEAGYHVLAHPGDYVWGSNAGVLNAAVLLLAGAVESGDSLFSQTAEDQLHYILGTNGLARSFVTGVGSKPPRHPHHRPSASDGVAEPVPGLLTGGPNQYGGDPVLEDLLAASTPPALCYVDTVPSYASNEVAINWNAPLVFVAGWLRGIGGITGIGQRSLPLPDRLTLEQNYPNPFNGSTRIRFAIHEADELRLRVVDVLGNTVAESPLGVFPAGSHEIRWDASVKKGGSLSSGVYFYSILGTHRSPVRKLLYLR